MALRAVSEQIIKGLWGWVGLTQLLLGLPNRSKWLQQSEYSGQGQFRACSLDLAPKNEATFKIMLDMITKLDILWLRCPNDGFLRIQYLRKSLIFHLLAVLVRQMRLKSRQIPGKELEKLIKALTEVMALFINLLPPRLAKSKVAETIVDHLLYIISALEGTSPTADSGNSHLPGSKDISPPKKRAKQKKGKKRRQGGQPNHKGATLLLTENPNEVVYLTNDRDNLLNNDDFELVKTEKRQVTELRIEKWVTEYRVEFFRNKKTGEVVHGQFPADAKAPAQYGPSVKLLARLLNLGHMIPFERVAKLINSIGSLTMSAGTVFNMCKELHAKPVLKAFRKAAEKSFIASRRCNADETGVKLNGILFWLHIITDAAFILIFPNKKRGKEAMEAMGIIGKLTHYLCHDCWRPYFHFKNVIHCLCNYGE